MNLNNENLVIWDIDTEQSNVYNGCMLLWRAYPDDRETFSIPEMIERNTESLRKKYVSWVYSIGQREIEKRKIVDILSIRPGFSYWWMTEFAEMQHYGKTPQIYDVIRLLALEEWVHGRNIQNIHFITDRDTIIKPVLEKWCKAKNIHLDFEKRGVQDTSKHVKAGSFVGKYIPDFIMAGYYLLHYSIKRIGLPRPINKNYGSDVSVFDYLLNTSSVFDRGEKFRSLYWPKFGSIFSVLNIKVNWMHSYVEVKGKDHLSIRQMVGKIIQFNANTDNKDQFHSVLNSQLTFGIFCKIIKDYMKINLRSLSIRRQKKLFVFHQSEFDFRPLFINSLRKSITGVYAISNLIYLNQLEEELKKIPKQKLGFFLQENMGWENALLYLWKANGHGKLIGVPHVTIRPWDLRYYVDKHSFIGTNHPRPRPDIVALNSASAIDTYIFNQYNISEIRPVEALRYLYLTNLSAKTGHSNTSFGNNLITVLILGDYLFENTDRQLKWVASVSQQMKNGIKFIFKQHPACPVEPSNYGIENIEIATKSFMELFEICDIAFATNVTSAIVDAYSAGLLVISMLYGDTFNMSPLTENEGVIFVKKPADLMIVLQNAKKMDRKIVPPFFFLDESLLRWRKLVSENGYPQAEKNSKIMKQ